MNGVSANIHFKPLRTNKYAKWFEEVQFNGKVLSDKEREECVTVIDETLEQFTQGLPTIYQALDIFNKRDTFHQIYRTITSVMIFVVMTMIDCLISCKYFIIADKDYDRRFMRGKMMVILNEGFKKLYGFDDKTHKKSEWYKLFPLMSYFPEEINRQYQDLTYLLEKHAKSSSWWKEERNLETHLEATKLYMSRQEEIVESKVVIDSMKLYCSLMAVHDFLTNLHTCAYNYLVDKYNKGELLITQ